MRDSNVKEIFFWLIRLRQRYRVTGASMQPLFWPGDEVLVDPQAYRRQPPCIGEIIVARHPTQDDLQIIKRIKSVGLDGRLQLLGDNPDSTQNSPSLVPAKLILGRVTSLFAQAT